MTTIVVERVVPVPAPSILETFWSVAKLRASWPHILAFDVHYEDLAHQEVSMTVDRDGAIEQIRVVRFRRGNDIEFFNPVPPPAMTYHVGLWRVTPLGDARSHVRIERAYDLQRRVESDVAFDDRQRVYRAAFRERLEAILTRVGGGPSSPALPTA
jgi:hypothetical protein